MSRGRILSGMRPTGRLHMGHLSVLENWVRLQEEYDCFYTIVDWHALTTSFDEVGAIQDNIRQMLLDWLSVGIDPQRSAVFVQSHVKEHAELHLLFSMFTPLSWLERVPTYKDQVQQLGQEGKDISTYGFLGYPLLQAADILVYRANAVPVGEDQLPHLELCREIARRFNFLYREDFFPEPQALLSRVKLLPGIDGRKMSKSYHNDIPLDAPPAEVEEKVRQMVTDPARIHKSDPGHPEVCVVHAYQEIYDREGIDEVRESCRGARVGCVACKKSLAARLNQLLEPIRQRKQELLAHPHVLDEVLAAGEARARAAASDTMREVRQALGLD